MKKILLTAGMAMFLLGSASADFCNSSSDGSCQCDPCNCGDGEFYAYADYLYWTARRCDLDFVIPRGTGANIIGRSEVESLHPHYDSGIRVGLGYTFCQGFDLSARYTHFNTDGKRTVERDLIDLYATRLKAPPALYLRAVSKYDLEYDVVDIELGSFTRIECDSGYRYFFGAKLAFVEETMHTVYSSTPTLPVTRDLHEKLDLDAYGLTAGLEFYQNFFGNWGLYGRGSLGLLVGNYTKKHVERDPTADLLLNSYGSHDPCFVGIAELAAGLYYDFCNFSCVDLRLAVGYEFHGWLNTQDFIQFPDHNFNGAHQARNLGSLGLDGLFVRLMGSF